ncbi:hypothetical protein SAMN06295920_10713 [Rhizorhabdus histidinilytica]|uniref:AlpA family phage regulatory protein n=1 Tax=Rhizorhabdus histidinilytica TaxID=439228 RepID=A0A1T5EHZ1_9SPHN|nr:hypothetical protein SAMN06295920_10713 [Rhizorhabdus histidinilytica]
MSSAPRRFVSDFITVSEFAELARMSRRSLDRLRQRRPDGFPTEYDFGTGEAKQSRQPRFKLEEVRAWLDSRALW